MKRIRKRRSFSIFLIALFLAQIIQPIVDNYVAYAASTKTMYIDFSTGTLKDAPVSGSYYSGNSSWTKENIDLSPYITGNVRDVTVTVGSGQTATKQISGNSVSITVQGDDQTVYGQHFTNPGHQIYRLPSGKRWEHKGAKSKIFQFDPDDASSGISLRPGRIPVNGYIRQPSNAISDTGTTSYRTGGPSESDINGQDLRYEWGYPPYDMTEIAPDWDDTGAAVTRSYDAAPPSTFYKTKQAIGGPLPTDPVSGVDTSTIRLVNAESKTPGAEPYSWGYINGTNQIAVRRVLDTACDSDLYCEIEYDDPNNYGLAANYLMEVYSEWTATTYAYSGSIEITYEVPAKADLSYQYIKHDLACIQVGDTVTLKYGMKNIGISTATPFKVQMRVDGTVFFTSAYFNGANNNVPIEGTATYKFTSTAPMSFTLVVDSGNEVDDESRINNVGTVSFTAKDDCSSGGGGTAEVITGTLTVEKPSINYGDSNFIKMSDVSVTGGASCALSTGKMIYTQGSITRTYNVNQTGTFNSQFVASPYNGFGTGVVSVKYEIVTTCGTEKTIGPGSFVVNSNPGNSDPQFEASWFDEDFYSGGYGQKITTVPVGETVSLGHVTRPKIEALGDNGTPYDPDGDSVIYYWDFDGSASSWIRWLGDDNVGRGFYAYDESFSNIKATELGTHTVQVTGFDGRGGTAGPYNVTLSVVDPNPVPVITLPPKVIEGRPFTPDISCASSYSPYKSRTISSCDWHGTKLAVYPTAGNYTIQLDVTDSTGLVSKGSAYATLNVQPDIPPTPDLLYTGVMTRGNTYKFKNQSYSPDGDTIVKYKMTYGYDSTNSGSCNSAQYSMTADTSEFSLTPTLVGTYCVNVFAEENYGKTASKDYSFEVINDSPEGTFTPLGITYEPPVVNITPVTVDEMMGNSWSSSTLDSPSSEKYWVKSDSGTLATMITDMPFNGYASYPTDVSSLQKLGIVKPGSSYEECRVNKYIGDGTMFVVCSDGSNAGAVYRSLIGVNFSAKAMGGNYDEFKFNDSTQEMMKFYKHESSLSCYSYDYYYLYKYSSLRIGDVTPFKSGYLKYDNCENDKVLDDQSIKFSDGEPFVSDRLEFPDSLKHIYYGWGQKYVNTYSYKDRNTVVKRVDLTDDQNVSFPLTHVFRYFYFDGNRNLYNTLGYAYGRLVKIDRSTGIPTVYGESVSGYWDWYSKINKDGTVAKSTASWNQYFSIPTRTLSSSMPPEYSSDFSHTTANPNLFEGKTKGGFAFGTLKTSWCTDSNGYNSTSLTGSVIDSVTKTKVFDLPTICSSSAVSVDDYNAYHYAGNSFLEGTFPLSDTDFFYYGYIYRFTPNNSQPPDTNEGFTFGQLFDSSRKLSNGTISANVRFNKMPADYLPGGISFRAQDHKNMYRVESMKNRVILSKIVNGRKTTLKEVVRPLAIADWNKITVKLSGSQIKIYENGSLLMEVWDSAFIGGSFGPYSTVSATEFKDFQIIDNGQGNSFDTAGYALVSSEVKYETTYSDPESDPKVDSLTQWKYTHLDPNMFLDSPDDTYNGVSAYHGASLSTPVLSFDKVGLYRIDYQVPDDPNPNYLYPKMEFQSYRRYSDVYSQNFVIHRKPYSLFLAAINGSGTVDWTDQSYDPDRCFNTSSCQASYATNHGIYEYRYYYVTPSGVKVDGKLVRPAETGSYTIAQAVRDEYGAWSDWYEAQINATIVVPNSAPGASLSAPAGTYADPTPVSLQPTIVWDQWDADANTTFTAFNLNVKDEWGNCVECVTNKPMNTQQTWWSWTLDTFLANGNKYQVQVQVSDDGNAWSGWTGIGWMSTNTPPSAFMSYPWGTQASPNVVNTTRPTFTWAESDPDAGALINYYQVEITNEANTVVVMDSGKLWRGTAPTTGSWVPSSDLPTGVKLRVRVKVWDQYGAESNWSPQTWFTINRAPVADFTVSPSAIFEGDTITLTNTSSDPDGDAITATWYLSGPGGYSETQFGYNASIAGSVTANNPGVYTATLVVTDTSGATGTATKSFTVLALGVTGAVSHTTQWNQVRIDHNQARTGTNDSPRPYSTFYAGEKFVLSAGTTDTGTSTTKATSVVVTFVQTGDSATLTGSSPWISWSGDLWKNTYDNLSDGAYTFRFVATYSNGVTKETTVSVDLLNSMWETIGTHRIH